MRIRNYQAGLLLLDTVVSSEAETREDGEFDC